jgi:hypothetical protein
MPEPVPSDMPVVIDGVSYFTSADVKEQLGVARAVLWRWRTAKLVPQGRYNRRRHLIFTAEEFQAIKDYANRVEPARAGAGGESKQLRLFNGNGPKKKRGGS